MSSHADEVANVSRETLDLLSEFHDLVVRWNPRINLISKSSLPHLWNRHIWDSAQLVEFSGAGDRWVDIGSGGGFPGIIVAIIAKGTGTSRHVVLVESDQRKSAFLRTAIRELGLNAEVRTDRIENIEQLQADIISARAVADLDRLLALTARHLTQDGIAYFLKGEQWEKEVQTARDSWSFSLKAHKSKTNPAAAILEIKEIERV